MGKRRWTDEIGQGSQGAGPDKKQKKRNTGDVRPREISSKALPPPSNSSVGNRTNQPSEPPSGLSKGQRKRWRRRQRKQAKTAGNESNKATTSNLSHGPVKEAKEAHLDDSSSRKSERPHLGRAPSRQFAVTKLVPRPKKRWEQVAQPPAVVKENETSTKSNTTASKTGNVVTEANVRPVEVTTKQEDPLNHPPSQTSSDPRSEASHASLQIISPHEEDGSVNKDLSHQQDLPDADVHAARYAAALNLVHLRRTGSTGESHGPEHAPTQPADVSHSLVPPSRLSASTTISFRRPSFVNKANNVPSYSDNADAVDSFKRFSAFLQGERSDSSDDESEESSEESKSESSHGEDPSVKQAATMKIEADDEVEGTQEPATSLLPTAETAVELEQHADSDSEHQASEDEDCLPKFSKDVLVSASGSPFSWPANVGIKRQLSLLVQESGVTQSGPGSETGAHKTGASDLQQPDPFAITDEDSENAIRTVDEITNNMLGTTRPLPPSKPPRDSHDEDHEELFITVDSSYRRLKIRGVDDDLFDAMTAARSDVVVCNSVQLPDIYPSAISGRSDFAIDDMGKSYGMLSEDKIIAMNTDADRETAQTESSSSLSELSRSPSPPDELAVVKSGLHESADETLSEHEEGDATVHVPNIDSTPKKKRKMTGRTSKHFSPEKKAKRTRTSAKIDNEPADAVGVDKAGNAEPVAADAEEIEPPKDDSAAPSRRRRRTRSSLMAQQNNSGVPSGQQKHGEETSDMAAESQQGHEESPPSHSTRSSAKKKRKTTGKCSSYFTPTKPALDPNIIDRVDFYNSTGKKKRVPAGTSTAPVPSINSDRFGIIQEKLWREPFWLLIAVTFLNKTAGRAAAPIFWSLKESYPTPEALAVARQEDLHELVYHLGLQVQRSKRVIKIAKAWVERPPMKGVRFRTLHYPSKGDGKGYKPTEAVEEDADEFEGALEIGHIPGCGPYAWDSWRIFCRDVLRGLSEDYNGEGPEVEGFVPEWQRVLPLDKELRACLRWMWLREGWIWDHETGDKRRATDEEMEKAVQGEMEISDPQERKFAAQAAGVELVLDETPTKDAGAVAVDDVDTSPLAAMEPGQRAVSAEAEGRDKKAEQLAQVEFDSDNIVVSPPKTRRRKAIQQRASLSS